VVRAAAGDDLVALAEAAHDLDLLGDLDGGLDRLRAAGAEEEPVEVAGSPLGQHRAELNGGDRREVHRRGITEPLGLLSHRLGDLDAAVARVDDPETGDTVEVGLAVDVPERRALGPVEDPEPALLGQVHPWGGVDPDVVHRRLLQVGRGGRVEDGRAARAVVCDGYHGAVILPCRRAAGHVVGGLT
jgi:hypothetical protein